MRVFLPLVFVSSTIASPVTLTLGSEVDENVITVQATVNETLSDTTTTIYSGTIDVDLTILDGSVTAFEMTGGTISATDSSLLFEIIPLFSQAVTFESLQATPVSPNGPETLTIPGHFSALQHYLLFNQGCVLLEGTFENSKSLVSTNPFIAAGDTTGTITLESAQDVRSSLTNELIATRTPVSFVLPLNSTVSDGDETLILLTQTTGTVTAGGAFFEFTHPFYEWATTNAPLAGAAISFTADADADGQQDGISWALGFAGGAPEKQLHPVHNTSGEVTFNLPGPTRHALTLQKSSTLSDDDWSPVAGYDPLPSGSTGTLTLPGATEKTFYRFTATFD